MTVKTTDHSSTVAAQSHRDWKGTAESHSFFTPQPSTLVSDNPIFEPWDPDCDDSCSIVVEVSSRTARRLRASVEDLEKLLELPPNWDSYGARPIQPAVFLRVVKLLAEILETRVPRPAIVPTPQGGIQLEWHRRDADLEILVQPGEVTEVYLEMGNGETWEGPLANSRWRLERFLDYVREQTLRARATI